MVDEPNLSPDSARALFGLLENIQLPLNTPDLEQVAGMWAKVQRELSAIIANG